MVVVVKVASLPRRRILDTRRDAALRRLATDDQNDDVAMVGGGGGIYHRFGRFGRQSRRRPLKGGRRRVSLTPRHNLSTFLLQRFSSSSFVWWSFFESVLFCLLLLFDFLSP